MKKDMKIDKKVIKPKQTSILTEGKKTTYEELKTYLSTPIKEGSDIMTRKR